MPKARVGSPTEVLCAPGGWQYFARRTSTEDLGRIWASIGEALRAPGNDPIEVIHEYRLDSASAGPLWIRDAMTEAKS